MIMSERRRQRERESLLDTQNALPSSQQNHTVDNQQCGTLYISQQYTTNYIYKRKQ